MIDVNTLCISPNEQIAEAGRKAQYVVSVLDDIVNNGTPTTVAALYEATKTMVDAGNGDILLCGNDHDIDIGIYAKPAPDEASKDVVVVGVVYEKGVCDALTGKFSSVISLYGVNRQDAERKCEQYKHEFAVLLLNKNVLAGGNSTSQFHSLRSLAKLAGREEKIENFSQLGEVIKELKRRFPVDGIEVPKKAETKEHYLIVTEFVRPNGVRLEHRVVMSDEAYEFFKDKPLSYERINGPVSAIYCDATKAFPHEDQDEPIECVLIRSFKRFDDACVEWMKSEVAQFIAARNKT